MLAFSNLVFVGYAYRTLTNYELIQSQKEFDFKIEYFLITWHQHPYLCEGNEDYYRQYLSACFMVQNSAVVIAYDQEEPIGFLLVFPH